MSTRERQDLRQIVSHLIDARLDFPLAVRPEPQPEQVNAGFAGQVEDGIRSRIGHRSNVGRDKGYFEARTANAFERAHQIHVGDSRIHVAADHYGQVIISSNSGMASIIGLRFTGIVFTTIAEQIRSAIGSTASTYHVFPQYANL